MSVDSNNQESLPEYGCVKVENVHHYFTGSSQPNRPVLTDVNLHVRAGEFLALVGPSGCGKTTLLNMIAGLVQPTHGRVYRGDRLATKPDRSVSYMFARSALLPWRTVRQNVELGLEFRRVKRHERRAIADRLLRTVGLNDFSGSYPSQLSQGMRQRVALARTLAIDPTYILMDEPFAALDAQTKLLQEDEFVHIWEQTGKTVVFVTHDLAEAILMADRIVVFSGAPGRIKTDSVVPLDRPRSIDALRFDSNFQDFHEHIWKHLKDEVHL